MIIADQKQGIICRKWEVVAATSLDDLPVCLLYGLPSKIIPREGEIVLKN